MSLQKRRQGGHPVLPAPRPAIRHVVQPAIQRSNTPIAVAEAIKSANSIGAIPIASELESVEQ